MAAGSPAALEIIMPDRRRRAESWLGAFLDRARISHIPSPDPPSRRFRAGYARDSLSGGTGTDRARRDAVDAVSTIEAYF